MDEDILGQSLYLQWTNRQTRAINIPTMDEQTDKGNQYTYQRTNRQRDTGIQYTYDGLRQKRAIHIPTMDEDKQGQSIYLQWMNRQTITINIPTLTMNEQTDKGYQYTYDGKTNRQGRSIYLRWTKR
jgi:Fe-S cluster biosynthesis and repair protein YggX